jgi:hypothetical protein
MRNFKKFIIIVFVAIMCLNYGLPVLAEINEGDTITKTLYTNDSVANMSLVGTSRGNWHDKQNLGIYMPAGSSFEIRQTNLSFGNDLTLECLNNDSSTEKTYTISKNGDWVTVTVDVDSVPFIRTLADKTEDPQVEIRNMQGVEELTYYYYGDNEDEFFEKWNENNHSYAVIENDRATFLVPIKDRELIVRKNGGSYTFKSIDEMLEYYHDFVEQFDRFLGLSYDTDNALNKNVKTKFFVKANKHGAGAAYYGGTHTAQNGDSISGYLSRGWLNLHEFGHGYEGSLANSDMSLVDVLNNVLSHYYQITFLTENDGGWLGKKINVEESIKTARDNASTFNELSYQQRLYFFVDLLDKIGPEESMAYVHSQYRKYVSEGKYYTASDMFAKAFSEKSGYNVIPYMNSFKIYPSIDMQAEIYEQELPMLYYLKDLVATDEKAEQIRQDLNLDGKYDLVSNEDIAQYQMTGDLVLQLSIDDFEQIKGEKIYIKDGSNIVKEIVVDDPTIKIENLPVGIYTLQMPSTKTVAYEYDYQYVVIKENNVTNKEVEYTKIELDNLVSDTKISFRGLGDSEFATITMNLEEKQLNIVSNNMQPHVYFTDEYANIQIYDTQGNLVYEKSYIGNQNNPGNDVIDIEYGYTIKLKHREYASRLIFKSDLLGEKEELKNTSETDTYIITKYGLQKQGTTDEEQYEIYKRKVDKYIEKLQENIPQENQEDKYSYHIQKNILLSSILLLNEDDKEEYLTANDTLINGAEIYLTSKVNENNDVIYDVFDSYSGKQYSIDSAFIDTKTAKAGENVTVSEFVNNLNSNGRIEIYDKTGNEVSDTDIVKTGMTLKVKLAGKEKEYTIIVKGDVDGDGRVRTKDLNTLIQHLSDEKLITDAIKLRALDIYKSGDGILRTTDLNEFYNLLAE